MGRSLLVFLMIFSFLEGFSQAETRVVSHKIHLDLQEVLTVEMSQDNLESFVFNTEEAYESGIAQEAACTFKVKGNTDWYLSWQATSPSFTNAQGYQVPASVLEIGKDANYAPLTASASANGVSGQRGNHNRAGNTFSLSYKAKPSHDMPKGEYSIEVMYTLTPR